MAKRIRDWKHKRRPPAGSRPGVMVIPKDAAPPSIHVIDWTRDKVEECDLTDPAALACYARPDTVTWIEIEGVGDEARLRAIFDCFGIHALAMADVVNVPQRPRTDIYDGHDLVICRMAQRGPDGECLLEQVSFLVGPNWVISVQEGKDDVFDPVRARIRGGALIRQMGADYLAYALIDDLIDGYYPVVEALGERIEELEDEVVVRPTKATLRKIHSTRRELLVLHRTMRQQRDALNTLVRGESPRFSAPVRPYLRDAFDHAIQINDVLEGQRELAVGLMEIYLSSVSNRLNEIMKVLTIMSSIFIPLTFIAGVYGMNFDYMPELRARWAYPAIWGLMIAVALGLLAFFWRRGWIGERAHLRDDEDRRPD
jgi:magnesium transporter